MIPELKIIFSLTWFYGFWSVLSRLFLVTIVWWLKRFSSLKIEVIGTWFTTVNRGSPWLWIWYQLLSTSNNDNILFLIIITITWAELKGTRRFGCQNIGRIVGWVKYDQHKLRLSTSGSFETHFKIVNNDCFL